MVFSFTLDFRTQKLELLKYFMAGDCLLMAGDIYQNLPSQPKTVSCLLPLIKPLIRTPQLSKLREWFRDHTFMAPTQKGVGVGGPEICHMYADSIVFKQKSYCSSLQMGWADLGKGDTELVIFCEGHKCMTP